jgi:futalosine hydrolase
MIALLCSVDSEASPLLERMASSSEATAIGSKTMAAGSLAGQQVLICAGGMGKVNAAHAATLMITQARPDALIIFGIGGAYPSSGAKVGEVAVAREEIAGDEGVLTREGFKDTEYIGIPLLKMATSEIFNTYPASESLLQKALGALTAGRSAGTVHAGSFVTLSTCSGTRERARELEQRYRALCENMEGAAAAHVALSHGIPWLEVRGISNIVEDRKLTAWDIPRAARAAQSAVVQILEAWRP